MYIPFYQFVNDFTLYVFNNALSIFITVLKPRNNLRRLYFQNYMWFLDSSVMLETFNLLLDMFINFDLFYFDKNLSHQSISCSVQSVLRLRFISYCLTIFRFTISSLLINRWLINKKKTFTNYYCLYL